MAGAVAALAAASTWAVRADTPTAVELVVAPSGSGAACTAASPCDVDAAQARARLLDADVDVAVVFTDGVFRLAQPLSLAAADGGRNGHHVVYRAAPGARPVVSGARQVTGWTRDAATGTWSAPVPPGTASRELYVNGARQARTSTAAVTGWVQTPTGYVTTDTSVLAWPDPTSVELVFSQGNGFWTEPRCDVASVAAAGPGLAAVTVTQPCWSNLHIDDSPSTAAGPDHSNGDNAMGGFEGLSSANPPSSVENVGTPLAPGQWHLDRTAWRVVLDPAGGVDPNQADVELPVLEQLVVARGTLDQPIENLTIDGLSFLYTTWLQPSGDDGFAEMQANMTLTGPGASAHEGTCQYTSPAGSCPFAAWTKPPASVSFEAAHDVTVERCLFAHLGAAGLGFAYGSQHNLIQGNEVTDTSGSGITLGDTTDPLPAYVHADDREVNQGNTISDNYVHAVAAEYHGGVGIWVGYTRGTKVAHNELGHLPYSGISFGWGGWHTDSAHADNPSITGDNRIEDNLIYDYLTTLQDGGAIYTNGTQGPSDPTGPAADPFLTATASPEQMAKGLTIRGNVALVATWSEFAYYNDEGSDYITYDSNVEYQNHSMAHGGCDTVGHIVIDDNYWAQPTGGYICPPPPVDINISNHHVIPDHPGPSDIPSSLLAGAGLEPAFRALVTSRAPEVSGVGPGGPGYAAGPASQPVLVSGTGFGPGTRVFFGAAEAASVQALSANYLIATPPPGLAPGQVDVIVRTAAGTTAPQAADQYVVLPG